MANTKITLFDEGDPPGQLHRVEHSAVIAPGRYWRCLQNVTGIDAEHEDDEFEFEKGSIYLLTNLEYFDGKLHSVVFLDDPARSTQNGRLTLPLLLPAFEQIEDHEAEALREAQIAAIQGRVADLQQEMAEAQTNPALLKSVIDEGLRKWEEELARRTEGKKSRKKKAPGLPALSTNGRFNLTAAIEHRISSSDIEVFQKMAQRQGKIAEIRGEWLQDKVRDMSRVLEDLSPFFEEHAAVGLARAHDALSMAKEVEKGLRSLRLYTGEGVEIYTICTGASAPASEPLTVYQRKLFMDEEFAVWDDVNRMFDYVESKRFFKALKGNADLRQQLIPSQRGVVAMAVRRSDVNYSAATIEEAMIAYNKNRENKALFLLVRDGENWYQVYSDEPSHELSPRLFPTRDEMDQVFCGFDGDKIGFEDLRFTNRASEFDRKSLAYKRFLILACGLDHRKQLFGHFYPQREALTFISMAFQRKYMRFVADDDSDAMLGDTVGSVSELIEHNHDQLSPGCRVLVFGQEVLQQAAAPGAFSKGTYDRGARRTVYYQLVHPREKASLLTVRRSKDDLVVHLPVARKELHTYSGWGVRREIERPEFNVRVALNKLQKSDLGYLLTDLVKAEDLKPFIYNRRSRAHHVRFIYGFKLAMQILAAEEKANAATRGELMERAQHHFGLDNGAAEIAILSAMQGWRQKHPETESLPKPNSPQFAELVRELAEAAHSFTHALPKIQTHIQTAGGQLLRLMRGKRGILVAYYAQADAERDPRVHTWDWVGRRTYTVSGEPTQDAAKTVWLQEGRVVGEMEMWRAPAHSFPRTREPASLAKLKLFLDKASEMAEILSDAFIGERQGVSDRAWTMLTASLNEQSADEEGSEASRNEPALLPIGVSTDSCKAIGIRVRVYDLLYHFGSDAQRAVLLDQGYKTPAARAEEEDEAPEDLSLALEVDGYTHPEQYAGPVGKGASTQFWHLHYWNTWDPAYEGERRLDHSLQRLVESQPREKKTGVWNTDFFEHASLWIPPQYRGQDGAFQVSRLFPGLRLA